MDEISQQTMMISGIIMCILGLFGNILNLFVFGLWSFSNQSNSQHRRLYGTSNSPLYLFTSSIANLILILYSLITRIMFDGYQYIVKPNENFLLCKFRYFTLHVFDLMSISCLFLATVDRYLISSRQAHIRRLSVTRKRTIIILFFLFLINVLHCIPIIIYYQVSHNGKCFIDSNTYLYYYRLVFQVCLHGILPILFFSFLILLIYKQWRMIQQFRPKINQLDRQLLRMLFLMSIAIVISSIPYSIENIYYLFFTNASEKQTSSVLLFHVISSLMFYAYPISSFYIFCISTPNFRLHVLKILQFRFDFQSVRKNQVNNIVLPMGT